LKLSEMCQTLEAVAKANTLGDDQEYAGTLVAKISGEFTRVRDALSTELFL
jgi:hypothetical protein